MVYSNLKAPISVQYELTSRCNNNCEYCYNFWRSEDFLKNLPEELNEKEAERIIRKVGESEVFDFLFTGGGPLLRKKILFKLISVVLEYNMSVNLNSNLRLCTEEDAARFKEMRIGSIITTLSSYKQETHDLITRTKGSFKETIRGIKNVVNAKNKLAVNMVVTKKNKEYVYDTGKFLYEEFGITRFLATPISPPTAKDKLNIELTKKEIIKTLDDLIRLEEDLGLSTDVLEPIP